MLASDLISAIVLLILVTDPFGNVPLVVAAMQKVPRERRLKIILRECAIAYGLLLAFLFGGRAFLELMHLSETSLVLAGGIILFMIAIRMVFSPPDSVFGDAGASGHAEPFIVPLAIPAIAGPSALATVMLMASRSPDQLGMLVVAITAAMVVMVIVLALSDPIQRVVGDQGVLAMTRLMGLVLTALSIEMLVSGLGNVVDQFLKR